MSRLATAMVLLALVMPAGCDARPGAQPIEGPVLALLSYSPEELVLVEPDTLSVIKRVRLRSMGTDPAALADDRLFVTAQCGGVGDDADDVIALIDLRQGGRVRYLELPHANPGFVERVGDGTVLVSYGQWDPEGIPITRVDPGTGRVTDRALVANAYNEPVVAAGSLWTVGPEGENVTAPDFTLRRTALDLTASAVFPADSPGSIVVPDGDRADTVLLAASAGTSARVSRVSAADLAVITEATVEGLSNGVCEIINVGGMLVVRDSSGTDAADPGGPLIVLDRATLGEVHRIDVGGSVSSITALGTMVYAVTWDTGELVMLDPAAGTVLKRVVIPRLAGRMVQATAMDATDASGGP